MPHSLMVSVPTLRSARLSGLLAAALALGAAASMEPAARAQCAMCKEAAYDQHDQGLSQRLGRGFNASVYSMLGVPAVLLAGLVVLIRKNLRAQAHKVPGGPGGPLDEP